MPVLVSQGTLQRILHTLLDEEVSIRDLRSILEALAEHRPRTQDPAELTAMVPVAPGRAITEYLVRRGTCVRVIGLEAQLEQVLMQALGNGNALEPGLADTLMTTCRECRRSASRLRREIPACWWWGIPCARCSRGSCVDVSRISRQCCLRRKSPTTESLRVTRMIGGRAA